MATTPINRSIEEIIIISSAIIMAATITPFAIYRYLNGQFTVALLELLSIALMCAIGVYVWKTRKTSIMSLVTSAFMLTGLVGYNYVLGSSILFWIYPIIMTVYFLNSLKVSVLLVTPTMVALIPLLLAEKSIIEVISVIVTLVICQLFGLLLSRKIRQQYAIMQELVNQDGLTGALNRRAFDERVNFLNSFSLRHKKKQEAVSSLIMFDIDNFKHINDEFGHQEGDQVLINLTKVFKRSIRGTDQLYRYGGEEFVVIVNGADTFKATELAEKLRYILETSSISNSTKITASFGVAELQALESPTRWIDRADKAMYRAKRAGKNKVCIANYNIKDQKVTALQSATA